MSCSIGVNAPHGHYDKLKSPTCESDSDVLKKSTLMRIRDGAQMRPRRKVEAPTPGAKIIHVESLSKLEIQSQAECAAPGILHD